MNARSLAWCSMGVLALVFACARPRPPAVAATTVTGAPSDSPLAPPPPAPSAAPAAAATSASPTMADPTETYGASNARPASISDLCTRDPKAGIQLCQDYAPGDPSGCADACLQAYKQSLEPLPSKQADKPASQPQKPAAPPAADPYMFALGDCVHRVRDGERQPTCHFFRPLDAMDFGQKHCDAKCAELTEAYRRAH